MDDKAIPPDWRDWPLEAGPKAPMIDGEVMTHRQLLMLAVVQIAAAKEKHLTGRELIEIAQTAQTAIEMSIALKKGKPLPFQTDMLGDPDDRAL